MLLARFAVFSAETKTPKTKMDAQMIADGIALAARNLQNSKARGIPLSQTAGVYDASCKGNRSAPLLMGRLVGTKLSLFHGRFSTAFLKGFRDFKQWKQLGGPHSRNTPTEIDR